LYHSLYTQQFASAGISIDIMNSQKLL